MLKRFVRLLGGDPNKREIDRYSQLVDQVNALEQQFEALSDEALRAKTNEFRAQIQAARQNLEGDERKKAEQTALDEIMPEAFATVREASKRTIGLRHYDVQLIGGATLHHGKIAEMRTGEGKTLVATLPLYLNALTGRGVHLITVNDYLARRDARWMAPIYNMLGLSVGVLQIAARTENGKKAFIVDLERESPHEDQHQLLLVPRTEAYAADITYGTNSEFGFDYLRDNMIMRLDERVQRGHYFAIVDEVDNVLIDEARTPLIISGPAQDEADWYIRMAQVVKGLRQEDYEISEKDRTVTLTEIGEIHVEELLGMALRDPDRPEDVTPEQARLLGYLEQALRAQYLYRRNKDYLVQAGKVVIIDEFTGRLMPGRRWSDGLHQAVEAKEAVKVESESVTYATITIQNYFRMYDKLAGMTGTAVTEAEEFDKIYKLSVLAIPTNLEYQALRTESGLMEVEGKDPDGYRVNYYVRKEDPKHAAVYWRRKDFPDIVYRTQEAKLRAVVQEILFYHVLGRPLLIGTTSVEMSDRLSERLRAEPLRRLVQILLLRATWFEKNKREEDGRQIPELQFLNQPLPAIEIGEMRRLARDLGIPLSAEDPANLERLLKHLGLTEQDRPRLLSDLQGGIPHQVLNARKHTEESQIIAGAGAFGAVTIATNMAGRGVDIKLGGELAEEILASVNRVLHRAGIENPYDLTMEERQRALLELSPEEYGIYESEVGYYMQHMQDMQRVRELGGLHVIGSERHEARRIDNQLRGRSARQGDPGSSRFYLSMEDELMRLFGGQQADNLMQRMKIDDALPLEVGLVGRIVEQSQTRVEGANFDVRKHLLEYDDVLNTQRSKIYGQRNLIFNKEDLSEDVAEMLRTEVATRVPQSLQDEEGPWKLLSWLDSIQPPIPQEKGFYPSYSLRLIVDHLLGEKEEISQSEARQALLRLAEDSLNAEEEHIFRTADDLINSSGEKLDAQIQERLDAIDTFFEGLGLEDETDTRRPIDLFNELQSIARLSLKLNPEQQRQIRNDPELIQEEISGQVEQMILLQTAARLIGAIERRLEESISINQAELLGLEWDDIATRVLDAVREVFAKRKERYLSENGQITKDLDVYLAKTADPLDEAALLNIINLLPQGARAAFDRKTHRRVWQRTRRLTYFFYAARFLQDRQGEEVAEDVLDHLEGAQDAMVLNWGQAELARSGNGLLSDLNEIAQKQIQNVLGEEKFQEAASTAIGSFDDDTRQVVMEVLGMRALTEIYRQVLLGVISELWVEYLTQMEALRVSIGLEAYAQRDPLVQYKNRAFALFQELLSNMRLGVINRMFIYRPRDLNVATTMATRPIAAAESSTPESERPLPQAETSELEEMETVPAAGEQAAEKPASAGGGGGSKKRKRRRH